MRGHCIARINHTHLLVNGGYGGVEKEATRDTYVYDIEREKFA